MYEYLSSWTGVNQRPAPGALKNTGQINQILLGQTTFNHDAHKSEAAQTFAGLTSEFEQKVKEGMVKGPLYRLCQLTPDQQQSFVVGKNYTSPCFEAYSKIRLEPGNNFAAANTRLVIIDPVVPGVDLTRFNPQQEEILIRPGMFWAVTHVRTSLTNNAVQEIGLQYIGTTETDAIRATGIAKHVGLL